MAEEPNLYTQGSIPQYAVHLGSEFMSMGHGSLQLLNDELRNPRPVLVRTVTYSQWRVFGSIQATHECYDRQHHSVINACAACGYDPLNPPTIDSDDVEGTL